MDPAYITPPTTPMLIPMAQPPPAPMHVQQIAQPGGQHHNQNNPFWWNQFMLAPAIPHNLVELGPMPSGPVEPDEA